MVRQEWKKLLQNPMMMIVMIAVIIIPTIYTTLFLGSMWDPYGKVDQLPVAVVNEDRAADYDGTTLDIGTQLVDKLRENDSLQFNFVDAGAAKTGLDNGTYYMVITIPENFSSNAATVMDASPEKMELEYETNPGTNYIASKLSDSALEKIKNSVSGSVTAAYAEVIFDKFAEIGDGMTEAADGAGQIKDGLDDALDGNIQIADNLKTLASSTLTFKEGSETLTEGLSEYTAGVAAADSGAGELNDGVQALSSGINDYTAGVSQANDGAQQLAAGVDELSGKATEGVSQLSSGASQLSSGITSYTTGVDQLYSAVGGLTDNNPMLNGGAAGISGGVADAIEAEQSIAGGLGDLSMAMDVSSHAGTITALSSQLNDLNSAIQGLSAAVLASGDETLTAEYNAVAGSASQLLPGAGTTIDTLYGGITSAKSVLDTQIIPGVSAFGTGLSTLQAGLDGDGTAENPGLVAGISSYTAGVATVESNLAVLSGKSGDVRTGASDLNNGASSMASQLSTGISSLSEGVNTLHEGTATLVSNNPSLTAGAKRLLEGTSALQSGLGTLNSNNNTLLSGAVALSSGASQISDGAGQLSDGADTLQEGLTKLDDGADTLSASVTDGADEVNSAGAGDNNIDMFSAPVEANLTTDTYVENNGHAMSAYMMSVALWVGCIAFCIMYPLVSYSGKLKSGFSWWLSKATVLYVIAIIMSAAMIGFLHLFNGFSPANMGKTVLMACLAGVSFMSVLYFFNVLLGKVGSFLMLIFMVVQLAGSAGTYPIELSAGFVVKIHNFLPFSYTVDAFRKTICGSGSLTADIVVLVGIGIVFTIMTILLFNRRTQKMSQGKPMFYDFLEEHGLA